MRRRAMSITLILFLAALACNLPSSASQPTPPPTSTEPGPTAVTSPVGQPEPTAASTAEPTATAPPEEQPPPPPSGLMEVLEANVASGVWTYEEGLISGLKGLVGEVQLSDEFGETGGTEGVGIVLEAQRYLREGTDESVKTELARLLGILLVDRDRLAPFSDPEPETGLFFFDRPPGLAAPTDLQGDCVDLWVDGFPTNVEVLCFLFKTQTLGGYETRIYYPSWWESGGVEFAYAQAAHEALAEAWPHFQPFGAMGTIDLVFTILPFPNGDALAMVPQSEIAPERCLILVYPSLIQADQANPSSVTFGVFKQTIAHELFHCFQAFNYPDKFVDSSWAVHDWWGESTAEYFSNTVYPGVNFEWKWTSHFDSQALTKSTFEMSYENFEFFQYLANRIGDAGVISLLASLPAGNAFADQVAALSGLPEIQAIYHEFGQAYLDHQIMDTSGAPIPGALSGAPSKIIGSNPEETVILTAQPFTLGVKQLIFREEKIYTNVITAGDVEGERSARLADLQVGWLDDLPEQVIAGCGVEPYLILLTSTALSASPYEMHVVVTVEEEIGCDECLIGTWELNKASFETHMDTLLANPDFGVNFIEGGWRYDYSPTGIFTGTFTDFIFNYTIVSDDAFGNPIFTDSELNVDGEGTAKYYVDSPGVLVTVDPAGDVNFSQKIWMNGDLIGETDLSEGGGMFNPVSASVSEYTCQGDVLSIRTEPLDLPQNTPVDYDRVDE